MGCLGRIFSFLLLLLILAAGWLYRQEISRWVTGIVDPKSAARRTGTPSPAALSSAQSKLHDLLNSPSDSILLNASELASLIMAGSQLAGIPGLDSITVELGDRTIRVRTMIATDRLPERLRNLIPGNPIPYEEVVAHGTLSPVRPGVAEWQLDRVLVRGLPIPSELVGRALERATGSASDGRLVVTLPPEVRGFRVRPEGVAIYREPAR
jgi:hypothetical protein